jgi:very-short-patch-repair endonuclease
MSFGPLNGEGGERRLNVLISRARRRCEVFTNLTHDDIDLGKTSSRGVAAFKTFLKYAQTGILDVPGTGSGEADSVFEEEVARALESCGQKVAMQVGSAGFRIDLAVVDPERPGRYLLAIECDGAAYHSSRSARDRDRLRQQVLEGLGWRFHRIWSTDWFRSPDTELRKVLKSIEAAKAAGPVTASKPPSPPPPRRIERVVRETAPAPAAAKPRVAPYAVAQLAVDLGEFELHEIPPGLLARWVCEVVDVEGPVHVDEVRRRIASASGVQRIGNRIQAAIDAAIAFGVQDQRLRRDGDFLWTVGLDEVTLRDRSKLPATSKKIAYVSDEEIAAAIRHVLEAAVGIDAAELPQAVGRLIGFGRVTEDMRSVITGVAGLMEGNGVLERVRGQLSLRRSAAS